MLASLLWTMAVLCLDVAKCVDEVQDEEERRPPGEGDGHSLMQTEMKRGNTDQQTAMTVQTNAITSALELMPEAKAKARASALLGRL